ncbi:MAG: NUDIX domain-containing protein [Actinomycetota bacterium]
MGAAHFRANVVAIVTDSAGRVMAFERGDIRGQWQLPQGGVDEDESVETAAWRELREETGLDDADVELIGQHPDWTAYVWPDGPRKNGRLGQCQRWFRFRVVDDGVEPEPDGDEFVDWRWVDAEWLVDNVVEFRRPSYRRVLLGHG